MKTAYSAGKNIGKKYNDVQSDIANCLEFLLQFSQEERDGTAFMAWKQTKNDDYWDCIFFHAREYERSNSLANVRLHIAHLKNHLD